MGESGELDEIIPNGANIAWRTVSWENPSAQNGRQLREIERGNENGEWAVFIEIKKMNVEKTQARRRGMDHCSACWRTVRDQRINELARKPEAYGLNGRGKKRTSPVALLDEADVKHRRCCARVNYSADAFKERAADGWGVLNSVIAGLEKQHCVRFKP